MRTNALRLALVVMLGGGCGGGGSGATARAPAPPPAPPPAPAPAAPAPATGCTTVPWKDDQNVGEATYRGKLVEIEADLPDGTTEKALIVFLDKPACLPAGSDEKETDSIHVFSPDRKLQAQLQALREKQVVVTGEGFLWHTAHHRRPIVVDVKSVAAR